MVRRGQDDIGALGIPRNEAGSDERGDAIDGIIVDVALGLDLEPNARDAQHEQLPVGTPGPTRRHDTKHSANDRVQLSVTGSSRRGVIGDPGVTAVIVDHVEDRVGG